MHLTAGFIFRKSVIIQFPKSALAGKGGDATLARIVYELGVLICKASELQM